MLGVKLQPRSVAKTIDTPDDSFGTEILNEDFSLRISVPNEPSGVSIVLAIGGQDNLTPSIECPDPPECMQQTGAAFCATCFGYTAAPTCVMACMPWKSRHRLSDRFDLRIRQFVCVRQRQFAGSDVFAYREIPGL